MKRQAISNYLFYLAFENTLEPGYVTEKVYDALIAGMMTIYCVSTTFSISLPLSLYPLSLLSIFSGVVPIYLGDSTFCRILIPIPHAVIYVDDFGNDLDKLVIYLKHLSENEAAYELHRSSWRQHISGPRKGLYFTHLSHALDASSNVSELVLKSWPCRICEWAINQKAKQKTRNTCYTYQTK